MELKKIGVLSLAKVQAIIMALFGLVVGFFIGVIGVTFGAMAGARGFGALGFLAVIILPIVYGVMGFVLGAVTAFVYNLIAGWVGGIEMEFKK